MLFNVKIPVNLDKGLILAHKINVCLVPQSFPQCTVDGHWTLISSLKYNYKTNRVTFVITLRAEICDSCYDL